MRKSAESVSPSASVTDTRSLPMSIVSAVASRRVILCSCSTASLRTPSSASLGMFQPKASSPISEERNCTVGARSRRSVPSMICMVERRAADGAMRDQRPRRSMKRMDWSISAVVRWSFLSLEGAMSATWRPARASAMAAIWPASPAPVMAISKCLMVLIRCYFQSIIMALRG
ncbi:hypothetical protein D3C72_1419560 [compost metagenome]